MGPSEAVGGGAILAVNMWHEDLEYLGFAWMRSFWTECLKTHECLFSLPLLRGSCGRQQCFPFKDTLSFLCQ